MFNVKLSKILNLSDISCIDALLLGNVSFSVETHVVTLTDTNSLVKAMWHCCQLHGKTLETSSLRHILKLPGNLHLTSHKLQATTLPNGTSL